MSVAPSPSHAEPPTASGGRLTGLIAEEWRSYTSRLGAEVVDFTATRGGGLTARAWLEAAASFRGEGIRGARGVSAGVIDRLGLGRIATVPIAALDPLQRAVLAIAELAVSVAERNAPVVVPAPPLAWPMRHEARRAAVMLFVDTAVTLHAYRAWELMPFMGVDALVDAAGRPLRTRDGGRSFVVRVYGTGAPYEEWRASLEALGARVEGGPISHLVSAPESVGARELLAAAFDAGLDVLEVRDAVEG